MQSPTFAFFWFYKWHYHKCIKIFINSYRTLLHFKCHHFMPHFKPLILYTCSLYKCEFFVHVISTMIDPIVKIAVFREIWPGGSHYHIGAMVVWKHYCAGMHVFFQDIYQILVIFALNFINHRDACRSTKHAENPSDLFWKSAPEVPSLPRNFRFVNFDNPWKNQKWINVCLPIMFIGFSK